jgi:peroxiredoxin
VGLAYGACDDESARNAKRISYVIGPEGTILAAYPKVDAARHPEEVLKAL